MSQELIVHSPAMIPYSDIAQMGRVMAASKLFGIQNEQQAIALMLLCQSENMHPAVAMRDFHIISGRPAMKADAMLSRFKAAGGRVKWLQYTDDCVEGTFTSPDGDSLTLDWTPERVKKAQLGGNAMHSKFPRQMLKARCISEGIRAVYPGVLSGLYAPEEVREFHATAETSGPDRPELPDVDSLLADLAACQTVDQCRLWLPAARQALHLKPGDPLYIGLTAEAKARAEQITAAQTPEPAIAPLPRPPVMKDGITEPECETELEMAE